MLCYNMKSVLVARRVAAAVCPCGAISWSSSSSSSSQFYLQQRFPRSISVATLCGPSSNAVFSYRSSSPSISWSVSCSDSNSTVVTAAVRFLSTSQPTRVIVAQASSVSSSSSGSSGSVAVAVAAAAAAVSTGSSLSAQFRGLPSSVFSSYSASTSPSPSTVIPSVVADDGVPPSGVRPRVLFVLGGPGSGKGTQSEMLVREFGLVHFSAGELLRHEIASGSKDGKVIDELIRNGKLVPAMRRHSGASRFVIDGFPRNFDNMQTFERMVSFADVDGVLFYDCSESELQRRLLERGKSSGRSDDNIASIAKRFRTYIAETLPVIEYYQKQNKVIKIYGDPDVDTVYEVTRASVMPLLQSELLALTQHLLTAIDRGDWSTYVNVCDQAMTTFEPEAKGHLVCGLPFHQFYFNLNLQSLGRPRQSTIVNSNITIHGNTGLVTYTRLVQHLSPLAQPALSSVTAPAAASGVFLGSASPTTSVFEETRVFGRNKAGVWRLLHFHRSVPAH